MDSSAPEIRFSDDQIEMAHGAGGKASRRLVEGLIAPLMGNSTLNELDDSAVLDLNGRRLALTTDSFVVSPLQFPGGSIGKLAVNGTVNDLAVSGAEPLALVVTFVLEAGLSRERIQAEVEAVAEAARQAEVSIVGGDTKVVENGKADGMYVTTTGIGLIENEQVQLAADRVRPGDQILLSGPIGDHGITILLARGDLDLQADLRSDSQPVTPLVRTLLEAAAPGLRWMRDPTRGGVASALNELAHDTGLAMALFEEDLPVRRPVRGACEILGLDPLHIANEGKVVAVVDPEFADTALEAIQQAPGGEEAALVGEVREEPARRLLTVNAYGGSRVVDMLIGDPLPRIC